MAESKLDLKKNVTKESLKNYTELVKKYRTSMTTFVKKANPFDFDAVYLFVHFLKFMQEYYVAGDNVRTSEITGHERVAKITEALNEFDLWDEANYICYPNLQEAVALNKDVTEFSPHAYFTEIEKERKQHWNKFWEIIRDEFLYWWD